MDDLKEILEQARTLGATREQVASLTESLLDNNLGIAHDLIAELRQGLVSAAQPKPPAEPVVKPARERMKDASLSAAERDKARAERWEEVNAMARQEQRQKEGFISDATERARLKAEASEKFTAAKTEFQTLKAMGKVSGAKARKSLDTMWAAVEKMRVLEQMESE